MAALLVAVTGLMSPGVTQTRECSLIYIPKIKDDTNDFWSSLISGCKMAAEEYGSKLEIMAPDKEENIEEQNRLLKAAIEKEPDAILFSPSSMSASDKLLKKAKEKGSRLIANNKKAYHDYFIEETYEAGIALHGTEVKSLRMGKCSIKESFVRIENEEVYIYGMHISPYEKGNIFNRDPLRVKKLLLHKSEIRKMKGKIAEKGYTLVPLKVYFNRSLVKVEIGLAKGKKLYDKRQDIAKKDQRREAERDFKVRNLY